jgi:hypothetical protein
MKKLVVLGLGGVLIAIGLIYGFTGMLVPSIQERGGNIERWQREMVKEREAVTAAIAEAKRLGEQPATEGSDSSRYELALRNVERKTEYLRTTRELVEDERGSRKEMMIITAAFAAAGVIALLLGLRMRR